MSDDGEFDYKAELELIRAQAGPRYAQKLSFPEKCALFTALRHGEKPSTVEKAYNLSSTTVSLLRNCLTNSHYGGVANEFWRLGEEEFERQYFRQDVVARLKAARLDRLDLIEGVPLIPGGADPRARKYAGEHTVEGHKFLIQWTQGRSSVEGWAVYDVENQTWGGEGSQTGTETGKPYRTSTDAVRDLYAGYGLEGPAKKIGRPRK